MSSTSQVIQNGTNRWQRLGTQHGPLREPEKSQVLGFSLANATRAEIAYWIAERAQGWQPTRLAFLNAHCANIARKDWQYEAALKSADAILPDGSGVELAARLEGKQLNENLNGTDLFPVLCRCFAFRKIPIFLLGGRQGVADAAADEAQRIAPNLKIAGTHHGFFAPQDEEAVIEKINRSGARVVMVAFGVPQQDIFLARIAPRLNAPVTMGVGGLFDFISGRIPRAPLWLRKRGLEWIYRLRQEPKRMWRRYILGNATFVGNAVRHAVGARLGQIGASADRFAKRCLDIAGAGIGLLVLGPALLWVAALIRLDSKGPALFRQIRVGENGREFELFKFRSMRTDAVSEVQMSQAANDRDDGVTFKLKKDPRITGIGAFIRKYSIDELPQLWNVLKGDMSLVGPRPAIPHEVEKYSDQQRQRLMGKPGLTCTWQISGRADLPFPKQVALDVAYLKHRSVWMDLAILLKTPLAVIQAKGAY